MDVSNYIAEFLHGKRQVKLPGLGSFVSTYQPARFLEENKSMSPPCRVYSFDPSQKEGDNSLALYIAGKENTPVSVAEKEVEEFIDGCLYVINKGKRLEIKNVGLLYTNDAGQIVFEQDPNLIIEGDFYGLPEIQVKQLPLLRKRLSLAVKLLLFVMLALILFAGIYYRVQVTRFFESRFSRQAASIDSVTVKADTPAGIDTVSAINQASASYPDSALSEKNTADAVTAAEQETLSPGTPQYYVVAGCFRSEEGAKKKVQQLKDKGFDARIFGKSNQGLNMVCYGSFPTKEEAKKFLARIIAETDPEAWLKKQ